MKVSHPIASFVAGGVLLCFVIYFFSFYPRHNLERHSFRWLQDHFSISWADTLGTVTFANEAIPLDDNAVRDSLLYYYTNYSNQLSQLSLLYKRFLLVREDIISSLGDLDVPYDFVYVPLVESNMLTNVASTAGAAGMRQLLPSTARDFGLRVDDTIDQRYLLEESTTAAASYFSNGFETFNDWILALASYNRGIFGIKEALELQKTDSFFDLQLNQQTSSYVYKIIALKLLFEKMDEFYEDAYLIATSPCYNYTVSDIPDISQWAYTHDIGSYELFHHFNPWIVGDNLPTGDRTLCLPQPTL